MRHCRKICLGAQIMRWLASDRPRMDFDPEPRAKAIGGLNAFSSHLYKYAWLDGKAGISSVSSISIRSPAILILAFSAIRLVT